MKKKQIHLVDDENIIHDIFKRLFKESEYDLLISENFTQAKGNHVPEVDVVILDQMIPGTSGMEIFKEIKKDDPDVQVIFLTAFGTIEAAIDAIKEGAVDYIQKPFDNTELKYKIDRVIREKRLIKENQQLKKSLKGLFSFKTIIGKSPLLIKALSMIENVADSNSTVLITGESGTGKELVAKAIHTNSGRYDKPFLPFNSGNIPVTLCESLLFGHKKGTFTGAVADKKGLFEEADGGTLFLDEIANLNYETQAKLLRAIQEKEIQPLGSNHIIKVDVRLIAATNVDLKLKVKTSEFREDLYYRLNIINIHLPPLRDRKEDIPALLDVFIDKFSRENKKSIEGVSEKYLHILMKYDWPGNIRELENTVLRSVLLSEAPILQPEVLPPEILGQNPFASFEGGFNERIEAYKRQIIQEAMEKTGGIQKKAAEQLKLNPSTLFELMKRLGIHK